VDKVVQNAAEMPPAGPSRVILRIEYPNGAVREFTADRPLEYTLAIEESRIPRQPRIIATFAGNPDTDGICGHSAGMLPG
jgi:hypothetical protein